MTYAIALLACLTSLGNNLLIPTPELYNFIDADLSSTDVQSEPGGLSDDGSYTANTRLDSLAIPLRLSTATTALDELKAYVMNPRSKSSWARDVNVSGIVVGSGYDSQNRLRPTVWSTGTATPTNVALADKDFGELLNVDDSSSARSVGWAADSLTGNRTPIFNSGGGSSESMLLPVIGNQTATSATATWIRNDTSETRAVGYATVGTLGE